ncbi:serine hydrolase [Glaciihabitans sp. dw_435]|uniref:serine hydrolase domain-containing protein n=1 Tax=Glaciihabitans sp. dw_435 TaxID=2720081 RepID=UPI001BD49FB4|nr:serine hydrolase domain-containing protein [Glaciihabitans sp. dw_435]
MTDRLTLSDALSTELAHWFDGSDVVSPSLNYAVWDRDGVVFHHGVGQFTRDGRAPEVDTIYRIASMSKSFLVAAVLVLQERGQLNLDDAVRTHVPEFRNFVDPAGVEIPITVRMLMANSSGMPEDNAWADYELRLSREGFLDQVKAGVKFADYPDVAYQYSNFGFWLLGLIVENISGQPFDNFATETLLEPLGLTRTSYDWRVFPEGGESGAGIAHSLESFDEGATWFDRPFIGDGSGAGACAASMYSTLPDIARWSSWLASSFDATNTDDAILSRASRRLMQRIHTPVAAVDERSAKTGIDNIGYGFGLFVEEDSRFGPFAHHSGGLPGVSTNMRWHLESGIGVAVFANTNGAKPAGPAAAILRRVMEEVDAPARSITLWPETIEAAAGIEASILSLGHVLGASDLFSPNLLDDVPAEERQRRLDKAVTEIGGLLPAGGVAPLRQRLSWALSGAHLVWTIPGQAGDLELKLEMTETTPSMIQRLNIAPAKPAEGSGSDGPVSRHYLPVLPPS